MKTITLTFDEASNCYNALLTYIGEMKSYAHELTMEGKPDEAQKIYKYNIEPQSATRNKLKAFLREQAPYLF